MSKTLFRLSSVKRQHDECQKIINEFTDEIIKAKIEELNENNAGDEKTVENDDEDDIGRKTKTVIEILIENYHEMSHAQIRDEIVTIMIGKYHKCANHTYS